MSNNNNSNNNSNNSNNLKKEKIMNKEKEEMNSGAMISEDYNAPSNLPREVKHVNYPKKNYFKSDAIDDTIEGIDKRNNQSVKKISKNLDIDY